jgi:protease-4
MKNKACCWVLVALGAMMLLFVIGTGIFVSSALLSNIHSTPLKQHSFLLLQFDGAISEFSVAPSIPFFGGTKVTTLADALKALKLAATDSRVDGVILRPTASGGFAEIRELRGAIQTFQQSHKPVYAYLEMATDRDYYLASVADTIVMNPARSAGMAMLGLGIESTYLARTFEKVGIRFHTLHVGEYKGAFENFSRDSMSTPLRTSLQTLLDDMFKTYTEETAESRKNLPPGVVTEELLNGQKLFIVGEDAKARGFVDLTMDWPGLKQRLAGDKDLNTVTPSRYLRSKEITTPGGKEVAVLFAEGDIEYKNDDGTIPLGVSQNIEMDDFTKQVRDLRDDDDVAAVVLRVNSPGGSALASELILNEIMRLKEKKPVIVSMGNVAASGGYYISCMGNRIIAQPNTITGSIGVVSLFPTAEGLFKKIGARVETVEKGKWYFFIRPDKDLTESQKTVILDYMGGIYDEFVDHVAQGRGMTVDAVKAVAQGRVWTGRQAVDNKLVDELGGLDLAVQRAKEAAHLEGKPVRVHYYPHRKDFFSFLSDQFDAKVASIGDTWLISPEEREVRRALTYLSQYSQHRDFVQAILPIDLP